jgi:hypothetical protein
VAWTDGPASLLTDEERRLIAMLKAEMILIVEDN